MWVACSGLRDVGFGLWAPESCGLWVVGSIVGCLQWAPESCGLWVVGSIVGCGLHCGLLAVGARQ